MVNWIKNLETVHTGRAFRERLEYKYCLPNEGREGKGQERRRPRYGRFLQRGLEILLPRVYVQGVVLLFSCSFMAAKALPLAPQHF